jgi:hypothetical protein
MLETYEQLKNLVAAVEDDVRRAAAGNKKAGTRVRKQMQDIKNKAQELRVKVLEDRGTPSAGSTEADSSAETAPPTPPMP